MEGCYFKLDSLDYYFVYWVVKDAPHVLHHKLKEGIDLVFFISNQFISNQPSDEKLLSNSQDSTLFH